MNDTPRETTPSSWRISLFRLYTHLYRAWGSLSGSNLPGLGRMLKLLNREFIFSTKNRSFVFDPSYANAYCLLPAGHWNEPETHTFLESVLNGLPNKIDFLDVGASVGEMVIDIAGHSNTRNVTAFEPQSLAANIITRSARANGFTNISVIEKAVSDKKGEVSFLSQENQPTAAGINRNDDSACTTVASTTLDEELPAHNDPFILLVDVEGSELEVINGGRKSISRCLPLIIFEYNEITRKSFPLEKMTEALGKQYEIRRLRGDAMLDSNFRSTWNCVAYPVNTGFERICESLLVKP